MIDLPRAKTYLAVEHDTHDDLIQGLIEAAVATIELKTGKFLSSKEYVQSLAGFPASSAGTIKLLRGPVTGVTSIFYDPSDGEAEIEIEDYRLVEGLRGSILPAYGESWPATLDGPGTVRIAYTAGFADGEAPDLDQASLLLVGHWYANREAVVTGTIATEIPMGVASLLRPHMPAGLA